MGKAMLTFEDQDNGGVKVELYFEDAQTSKESRSKYDEESNAHKLAVMVRGDLMFKFGDEA